MSPDELANTWGTPAWLKDEINKIGLITLKQLADQQLAKVCIKRNDSNEKTLCGERAGVFSVDQMQVTTANCKDCLASFDRRKR